MKHIKNIHILTSNKVSPKKCMGQHFLKSREVCNKILNQADMSSEDVVVEIGSGLGMLTFPASKLVNKLFAIEKDRNLVKILENKLLVSCINNVELVTCDIMNVDLNEIYKTVNRKLVLLGNLPYNIASQILVKVALNRNIFSKAIFMIQKEVAERVCSSPGSKNYSRLSVMLQYNAKLRNVLEVDPCMFFPKPKVKSSVIEIVFLEKPHTIAKDEALFYSIVKAAFSKRRKIIKNSLSKECLNMNECKAILETANIDPIRRAETLSVEEFVLLSNCFYEYNKTNCIS